MPKQWTASEAGFQDPNLRALSAEETLMRFGIAHLDDVFDPNPHAELIDDMDAHVQKLTSYFEDEEDPIRSLVIDVDACRTTITHKDGFTQIIFSWEIRPEKDFLYKYLFDHSANAPVVPAFRRDRVSLLGGLSASGEWACPSTDADFYLALAMIMKRAFEIKTITNPDRLVDSLGIARYEPGSGIAPGQGVEHHMDGKLNEVVKTVSIKGKIAALVGFEDDLTEIVRFPGQGTVINDGEVAGMPMYGPIHDFYNPFEEVSLSLVMDHHGIQARNVLCQELGLVLPERSPIRALA